MSERNKPTTKQDQRKWREKKRGDEVDGWGYGESEATAAPARPGARPLPPAHTRASFLASLLLTWRPKPRKRATAAAARPPAGLDLRSRETTLAHHAFSGYMRTQVCCLACGDLSKRYELVSNLVLDVSARATTLAAALQRFTATERLDGANKYK